MPKLHSNRLLLALTLTKLQQTATKKLQTKNHKPRTRNHEQKTTNNIKPSNQVELSNFPNIEKRISNLLYGINRKTINSELPTHNTTLRYGTSGVAWIYLQLHHQTGDNHFKEEMEYWINSLFVPGNSKDFSGMNFENLNAFGLLEGLGGILFFSEISENLDNKYTI